MTATGSDQDQSHSDSFDIVDMLMSRLSESERRKVADTNIRYIGAQRNRVGFTAENGLRLSNTRQRPVHLQHLQDAIRSKDPVAIEAAWNSCDRWLMADIPVDLAAKAANDSRIHRL